MSQRASGHGDSVRLPEASASGRPRTVRKRIVARNAYVEVQLNDVLWPDGGAGTHVRLVEPRGGAVALTVDRQSRVLLQRAYKYGVDREIWEAPRGYLEAGEAPDAAATRELLEETGVVVRAVPLLLGYVAPNTTVSASIVPIYLIAGPVEEGLPTDLREAAVERRWFDRAELASLLAAGDLIDGFTLAALALWWSKTAVSPGRGRRRRGSESDLR